MVRTDRVGKKRPFLRGVGLFVLTFGLYGIYWRYMALQEIYRQFELLDEGRDDGVVWLVLGTVVPVVNLVYFWKAVSNVRYVLHRLGREPTTRPGRFVGLYVGSRFLLVATILTAIGISSTGYVSQELLVAGAAVVVGASYGILAVAYRELQEDINAAWDAWEERVDGVRGPGSPGPGPAPRFPGPDPGSSPDPGGSTT